MKTFITTIPLLFLGLASAYTTPQPSCVSSRKAFLKTCAVVAPSAAFYVATASQPAAAFDGSGSNAYSGKGVTSKSDLKKSYNRRVIADIKVSICIAMLSAIRILSLPLIISSITYTSNINLHLQ